MTSGVTQSIAPGVATNSFIVFFLRVANGNNDVFLRTLAE